MAKQLPQQDKQRAQPPEGKADHLHVGAEGSRQCKKQPPPNAGARHQPKSRPQYAEGQYHEHGIFVVVVALRKKAEAQKKKADRRHADGPGKLQFPAAAVQRQRAQREQSPAPQVPEEHPAVLGDRRVHHHARQRIKRRRAVIPFDAFADGQKLRSGSVALLLPECKRAFLRSHRPGILP